MKTKVMLVLIIIITIIILGMSGYFVYNKISAKDNNKPTPKEKVVEKEDNIEDDTIKIDESKDYVYNADYKYESKIDLTGYKSLDVIDMPNKLLKGKGTIAVPYININTDDATDVNKEIKKLYDTTMPLVEESENCYNSGQTNCEDVYLNYVTYISDNYLSVIIITGHGSTATPNSTYYGYVFDLNDGHLLNIEAIASAKSMDVNKLENRTKEAIKKYGDEQDKQSAEVGQDGNAFSKYYTQTYTDLHNSINNQGKAGYDIDGIIYFFDEQDNLKGLVKINVGIEAGQYVYLLDIE